jgi:hypothetical protein
MPTTFATHDTMVRKVPSLDINDDLTVSLVKSLPDVVELPRRAFSLGPSRDHMDAI